MKLYIVEGQSSDGRFQGHTENPVASEVCLRQIANVFQIPYGAVTPHVNEVRCKKIATALQLLAETELPIVLSPPESNYCITCRIVEIV